MRTHERPISDLMKLRKGPDEDTPGVAGGHNEAVALLILLDEESLAMSELCEQVPMSRAAMTTMTDRFEHRGLATRCQHPTDRRIWMVELTQAGKDALAEAGISQAEEA